MSYPLDFIALGLLIQKRRTALNMSQYTLAEMSDIPRSAVRRIEAGDPNMKLADVYSVCSVLGLSISELFPSPSQSAATVTHLLNILSEFSEAEQCKIIEGFTTVITTIRPKINHQK